MQLAVLLEQLLAPVPGGTGRYTRELAAALVGTAAPGDTVAGWCAWHLDTRPAGVPGVAGPRRLPLPRRALALAWERGVGPGPDEADVVLAPTVLAPPARRPLVVAVHDAVPWTHPGTLTRRGAAFHRRMATRLAREAAAVLVPTQAVAEELSARLPLRPGQVHVVGEGVAASVAELPPDAEARRRRLDLPAGDYLLSLATLEPRKGLDVALAALARLPPGAPPLLVVGQPGWGGVDPLRRAAELGLAPGRVKVLGRLADPDLAVVLSGARLLLAPSRAEGFGLPVLEALAHGVPVVASDAPALVEVAGGAAVHVPAGDPAALAAAVGQVLADPQLAARLAGAGRLRARAFSWEQAGRSVWEVCRTACGHAPRA